MKKSLSLMLFSALLAPSVVHAYSPEPENRREVRAVHLVIFEPASRLRSYRIPLQSCASFESRLTHIKIKVAGNIAFLDKLTVGYATRELNTLPLSQKIFPGFESRWLDLEVHGMSDRRCVAFLVLTVRAQPDWNRFRSRTRVEVIGMTEQAAVRSPIHSSRVTGP